MQVRLAPGVTVTLLQFDVQRFGHQKIIRLFHPSSSITTWLVWLWKLSFPLVHT